MRFLNFLLSSAIFSASIGVALALAGSRYGGGAERAVFAALLLTAIACLGVAWGMRFAPFNVGMKIALYICLSVLVSAILVVHGVGLDGILPRRDGSQSIGLAALVTNGDLFALAIAMAALAGRSGFKKGN